MVSYGSGRRCRRGLTAAVVGLVFFSPALANLTASLELCVTVPSVLSILGPVGPVSITHDGTNNVQSFSGQPFTVLSNQVDGATVTFRCVGGFIHTVSSTSVRDCDLGLALTSADPGSNWTVDVPTDGTDVGALVPDLIAEVEASSDAPGDAVFALDVGMDGGAASQLPPGVYCTTIVATVTAN